MKYLLLFVLFFTLISCKEKTTISVSTEFKTAEKEFDFTLIFASCNDQNRPQVLWKPILDMNPNVFIWGGDNIYADTDDMDKMKADYDKVWSNKEYQKLSEIAEITGTWDDHDYGKNDAGIEWKKKTEAKTLLLDFLKVPQSDVRRTREGVYFAKTFNASKGSIKTIYLDTRTFRTAIKSSDTLDWRYEPWKLEDGGTILGKAQWQWLKEELDDNNADFTVIVSSIQFLNTTHGWEKWGNHPSEVIKMNEVLSNAKANNIFILSGDRHMAEISKSSIPNMTYPLIDFTASGMTHTWIDGATEANKYRISNVIKQLNFGALLFNFEKEQVSFQIRGENNFLYETYTQQY